MADKTTDQLIVGDSVKLPGYPNYVKITNIVDLVDRIVIEFAFNNAPSSCSLLKAMIPSLEPFDVKPVPRN